MCSSTKKKKKTTHKLKTKCNINCLNVDNIFVVVTVVSSFVAIQIYKCIHIIWWWWHFTVQFIRRRSILNQWRSPTHFLAIYSDCTVKCFTFFSTVLYCFLLWFLSTQKKKPNPSRSNTKKCFNFMVTTWLNEHSKYLKMHALSVATTSYYIHSVKLLIKVIHSSATMHMIIRILSRKICKTYAMEKKIK